MSNFIKKNSNWGDFYVHDFWHQTSHTPQRTLNKPILSLKSRLYQTTKQAARFARFGLLLFGGGQLFFEKRN
jgi:hypothetical protein